MLAVAAIVCAQYKRMRRLQPTLCHLDLSTAEGPIPSPPAGKQSDRVASALRTWSVERAQTDLAPRPRAAEPEPAPLADPTKELQLVSQSWTTLVVDTAPWQDESQWLPDPEPAIRTEPESRPTSGREERQFAPPAAQREEKFTPPAAEREERFTPPPAPPLSQNSDYYETLQISPNADPETIHRVYRIMAARFHPDNPTTGSLERFLQLREAYQTLSDPSMRAEYDEGRTNFQAQAMPVFWQKSFVDGIEGETNRRLGVLSLLYQRRRVSEAKPGISVMELERRMAFPREYLNFTLWYLRSKGFVSRMDDNSDYALTSAGVDFVESSSNSNKMIRELLATGLSGDQGLLQTRRSVVVQFPRAVPRAASRARVEGPRRIQRRKLAGRR
jgi:curved DNA-binding protein CbpA